MISFLSVPSIYNILSFYTFHLWYPFFLYLPSMISFLSIPSLYDILSFYTFHLWYPFFLYIPFMISFLKWRRCQGCNDYSFFYRYTNNSIILQGLSQYSRYWILLQRVQLFLQRFAQCRKDGPAQACKYQLLLICSSPIFIANKTPPALLKILLGLLNYKQTFFVQRIRNRSFIYTKLSSICSRKS